MRSRWFHVPYLHPPAPGDEKKVGWLELFYDLIFVASFIQLGNGLSDHVDIEGFFGFIGTFAALWLVWTGFTYYMNRFTVDDFTHRIVVFIQMFAVGAMAISAPDVLNDQPVFFSVSCAVALAMVSLMYLRAWLQVPHAKDYSRYWGFVFAFGAAVWAASSFVPSPWCYVLWAVGMISILASPVSRQSRALAQRYPTDAEHLSERYGLLTIIVLGESFVKVLSLLAGEGAGWSSIVQACIVLLITCCLWWIYFDDVAGSKLKSQRFGPVIWLYAHLPLQIAITAAGVAVKKAVYFDFDSVAPEKYRWLLCVSLALILFSVAIIDSVTERRQAELSDRARVGMRMASALLVLLLAPAGGGMQAWAFMVLVMVVALSQVLFDMMMAPLEEENALHEHSETLGDAARRRAESGESQQAPRRLRRDVSESVRKGAPSQLRRDLYVFFLEGTWVRIFGFFVFIYIMSNVIFAALYLLQPGCIANAEVDSFTDAFFFSVQTMSTIGYGGLAPATLYGDVIVTVEAAFGLLGVAIATGVMFAKLARPSSGTLFAEKVLIQIRDGKPTLAFRVGNARGTEIIDATMSVTVLKDVLTPEGHHLRRLSDLKLARTNSPIFTLSWLVMHVIDEESPLHGVNWANPQEDILGIICTMTGHDATYAQVVHARKIYPPESIEVGSRYVDVISELDDGRMMIDYAHFHESVPDKDARARLLGETPRSGPAQNKAAEDAEE